MLLDYKKPTSTSECRIISRCLYDPTFILNEVRIPDLKSYVMQQTSVVALALTPTFRGSKVGLAPLTTSDIHLTFISSSSPVQHSTQHCRIDCESTEQWRNHLGLRNIFPSYQAIRKINPGDITGLDGPCRSLPRYSLFLAFSF